MKRMLALLFGTLFLQMGACDTCDVCNDGHDGFLQYTYVDTILAPDTIRVDSSVGIVYTYPSGCNTFEQIVYNSYGDTLEVAALLRWNYSDEPCAHGPGQDTTWCTVSLSRGVDHYLRYRRSETETIIQYIYVDPIYNP